MTLRGGAIATNRFGMGARPGEITEAASDPRGWLKAQISPVAALAPDGDLLSASDVLNQRAASYGGGRPADQPAEMVLERVRNEARDGLAREIEARSRHAATTRAPFAERWVRFWSNHFTVAARNAQMIGLAGPFEREAIRPFVFGRFSDLLTQAALHPSMLVYLDAHRSIGPSTLPARRRDAGLNENLAREILELHTLGVGSGYDQGDVIEFAKALTGWTITGLPPGGPMQQRASARRGSTGTDVGAVFRDALHEPGARRVLGKSYSAKGDGQAVAILADLAAHPATGKHVATKLARHFIADTPAPSAVAQLAESFTRSGGNLSELAHTLVDMEVAWDETPQKFKTPEELIVSFARATDGAMGFGRNFRAVYQSLGQQPFTAPSPAGWPDDAAAWSGADAVKKRLEWANAQARGVARDHPAVDFLATALGPLAGERTLEAVSRAESREQGLVLALMSPEFQRR